MLLQFYGFVLLHLASMCMGSPVLVANRQLQMTRQAQTLNVSLELPEYEAPSRMTNYSDTVYDQLYLNANLSNVAYCVSSLFPRAFKAGDNLKCDLEFCDQEKYRFSVLNVFNKDKKIREKNQFYGAGFIAVDHIESQIVVSFRGTLDINDAQIDAHLIPKCYQPLVDTEKKCNECLVHSGFYRQYSENYKDLAMLVKEYMDTYNGHEVVVTGHSLGGAYAVLLGIDLQLMGLEPTVITFGGPKVGNKNFADYIDEVFNSAQLDTNFRQGNMNKLRNGLWRVIAKDDYVPLLPATELYYHGGLEFGIESARPVPQAKSEIEYTGLFKYSDFFTSIDWNQYVSIDVLHLYQHTHYFVFDGQCLINMATNPLNYLPI